MLHTENVAGGGKLSFKNVGGEGVYDVLTFQKYRGGQELFFFLNEALIIHRKSVIFHCQSFFVVP